MRLAKLLFVSSVCGGVALMTSPAVAGGSDQQPRVQSPYADQSRALERAFYKPPKSKAAVADDMLDLGAHICAPLFREANISITPILKYHGFDMPGHREEDEYAESSIITYERPGGSMKVEITASKKWVTECRVWSPVHDLLDLFDNQRTEFVAASGLPLQPDPGSRSSWKGSGVKASWGFEPSGATRFTLARD